MGFPPRARCSMGGMSKVREFLSNLAPQSDIWVARANELGLPDPVVNLGVGSGSHG